MNMSYWNNLTLEQRQKVKSYLYKVEKQKQIIDKAIEDIEFCLNSINQEKEMSIDGRTRNEMESCIQVLNGTLNTLRGKDNE